jgi:uncharacterized RDD family membrane protein YckC
MTEIHDNIQSAIQSGNKEGAQRLLTEALKNNPDGHTYYLAAQVALDTNQRRNFLKKALELEPFHQLAHSALEVLESASPSAASVQVATPPEPKVPNRTTAVVRFGGDEVAGFGARFVAYFIDGIIISLMSSVVGFIYAITPASFTITIASALLVVMIYGYQMFFLLAQEGQTLGKRAMKIKVIKTDGYSDITFSDAFLRQVVGFILCTMTFGIGFLVALLRKDRRGWHDLISDTVVVKAG